ncbi:MAG: 3'-5' exonuclease [Nanoarchaeota archaeon]|nr:3'-5' exonuclease [Nanoarchaeota archaeon]
MKDKLLPIVVDIETSGLDLVKSGIWQIGAIDLNTMEEFIDEARIDDEDEISDGALKVIGKTEEELRDKNKQSQKELIEKFMKWVETRKMKNFACHHPQGDIGWLMVRLKKYRLERKFNHKAFDTHSIAQTKFYEINKRFLIEEKEKRSNMGLSKILEFCGLPDERLQIKDEEIIKEGKPHNALEDAKLTAECFSRLMFGKNLFPEFIKFEVPKELRK